MVYSPAMMENWSVAMKNIPNVLDGDGKSLVVITFGRNVGAKVLNFTGYLPARNRLEN